MNNTPRKRIRWFHLFPVLAMLALILGVVGGTALAVSPSNVGASAGKGTGPTQQPTNTPCPRGTPFVFQINIINFSYQPQQAFFPAGTLVRWTNMDQTQHTVTSNTGLWDSGPIAQGQSFEFLIQNPGQYLYHDALNQMILGSLNVGTPPGCGPPPSGTPGTPPPPPPSRTQQGTPPPRTGTPPPPPSRTGTPQGTPPPPPNCRDCHLGILAVTSSCNPFDGAVSWVAVVHNPDLCVVRSPWRVELQIEENGQWHPVRTQFATFNFPPGDAVVRGAFCFQAGPNVHAVRVEFMFENPPGGDNSPMVKEVASETGRYSDTPSGGTSFGATSGGTGKEEPCRMHMASHPTPPCPNSRPCPPPPGTPPPGTPPPPPGTRTPPK